MLVGMGVVILVLGLAAWAYTSRRRRVNLRERFGPEYERTVEAVGPARAASVLQERADRVSRFNLRKLTQDQADAFAREWRRIQARFVDDPDGAVLEADQLVTQVMAARGYPLKTSIGVRTICRLTIRWSFRITGPLAHSRYDGSRGTPGPKKCVKPWSIIASCLTNSWKSIRVVRIGGPHEESIQTGSFSSGSR
jgi:hypothetical protein